MLKKMLKNQRGLTLIELLAVIVILGIIAAIAVPSIGNVIDNTEKKATVSEAIQIINAAKIAKTENPETNSFDTTALSPYVDNVEDDEYTVNYSNDGTYSITGHNAATIINSDATATTAIPETDLINYTK